MDRLNIAMVGYLNTLPFEYGLKKIASEHGIKLMLDVPSRCATYFKNGEADLALVPVGALGDLSDFETCLDYGIACDGAVRTVCLLSNTALRECHTVYLDKHSRTSRLLCQILLNEYLDKSVTYVDARISRMGKLKEGEAALMIGDKVFEHEKHFKYKYDLGSMWKEWTQLPFVFAVWIKRKSIEIDEKMLNNALKTGIEKIPSLVKAYATMTSLSLEDVDSYINVNLQYEIKDNYKKGMNHFLDLVAKGQYL